MRCNRNMKTIITLIGCVEKDVDYYGSDLTSYGNVYSFEDCKKKCQDYAGCTHFTYVPDDFDDWTILNTCHLKYATTGKMSVIGLSSGAVDCVEEELDTGIYYQTL